MGKNIVDFGAVGDGKVLNTEKIQDAVDAAKKEKVSVIVPPGVFLTGSLNLSGASLYLQKGAVLKASSDMADYPKYPFYHSEFGEIKALIICFDSEFIKISGDGIIDLSGSSFFDFNRPLLPDMPLNEDQIKECTVHRDDRPNQCLFFHNVNHLTFQDISIIDAPCWTITTSECKDVKALNLTIENNMNIPNNDGIHVCSCDGVIISGCHFSCADDCIAVTSVTNWEKTCENIVISDCVFRSRSKAIVLGYVHSHVRNVLINNVILRESNRGLCIMCNERTGLIENVRVNNMIIDTQVAAGLYWGNGEAVLMFALEQEKYIPKNQRPSRDVNVSIRNITLQGIQCYTENALGIIGSNMNIGDISLKDIIIRRKPSKNLRLKGEILDVEPNAGRYELPKDCGLYISEAFNVHVSGIRMEGFTHIATDNVNTADTLSLP